MIATYYEFRSNLVAINKEKNRQVKLAQTIHFTKEKDEEEKTP